MQKDVEAMTDAALSMGIVKGKVNKTKLMEDIDAMLGRYASVKSLSDLNIGTLMTDRRAAAKNQSYWIDIRSNAVVLNGKIIANNCVESTLAHKKGTRLSPRSFSCFVRSYFAASVQKRAIIVATCARVALFPGSR